MFSIHFDQLADRILRFTCFWVYFWSLSISCFQHSPSWVVCTTNMFIFTSWKKLPGFAYLFIPCNLLNQSTFSSISSFYLPSISRNSYNHNACQKSLSLSTPPTPLGTSNVTKGKTRRACSKPNAWITIVVPLPHETPVYYEERYCPISIARNTVSRSINTRFTVLLSSSAEWSVQSELFFRLLLKNTVHRPHSSAYHQFLDCP